MIANSLIKALITANQKAFVKIICLKNRKEHLTEIQLEEIQKIPFYYPELRKIAKFLGIKPISLYIYKDSQTKLYWDTFGLL